jgi:polyferredoxin
MTVPFWEGLLNLESGMVFIGWFVLISGAFLRGGLVNSWLCSVMLLGGHQKE